VLATIVLWFVLNRTQFGAHVFLTGDNKISAQLMGVNVNRVKRRTFAIMGFFAAFAGLVASFEVSYFWPTLGEGLLMNSIAGVFLGGTSVFGGIGTVTGTSKFGIFVEFNDGKNGIIDLSSYIKEGTVFYKLKDLNVFKNLL
jgi:simple sugar transport system permease protein